MSERRPDPRNDFVPRAIEAQLEIRIQRYVTAVQEKHGCSRAAATQAVIDLLDRLEREAQGTLPT